MLTPLLSMFTSLMTAQEGIAAWIPASFRAMWIFAGDFEPSATELAT
jgi:hypothetical protein